MPFEDEIEDEISEEESDDSWESDLESEAEIAEIMQLDIAEDTSNTGKKEYLAKCSELKIVPIAMFIAKLDCEHINLRHHGMGVKGALAVSSALLVNTQIRSLNLGDNWLRDDGTHALAQVLATNTSLTSINLQDNRIALPGVLSLCHQLQDNSTLAELSLRGNGLADRAAVPLSEAIKNSSSLTKVDLSYNEFGEEAGRCFGDMLNGHPSLLDVSLKWNSLKARGGIAVAEGLKANQVLNKVDLGWNGMGDAGMRAIGEMLSSNAALTALDVSHNRVTPNGCKDLAEGIRANTNLLALEVNFNPMGVEAKTTTLELGEDKAGKKLTKDVCKLRHDASGIAALVDVLKEKTIEELTIGLSNVQSGGSYRRGRASRFDPKNPDGHYALDLAQPWDRFIAETLFARVADQKGESWINVSVTRMVAVDGKPHLKRAKMTPVDLHALAAAGTPWSLPDGEGTLEFDYVTWKRGLEASFRLDLANPCDLFLAERVLAKAAASEAGGGGDGGDGGVEELRECKLNDEPLDPSASLPSAGILQLVYFSTVQQDAISFDVSLDLTSDADRLICLKLWERALTTPTDAWTAATLDGAPTSFTAWQYPHVPEPEPTMPLQLALTYTVRLAIKPYDRGLFFSPPMSAAPLERLVATLEGGGGGGGGGGSEGGEAAAARPDFDKVSLIRQAATRNYFTSDQVRRLVDAVGYRKGKIEAAVLLHPRTTDQANFVHALKSLDRDTDRQDILDMVGASIKRKLKKTLKVGASASAAVNAVSSLAAATAAARAPAGAPADAAAGAAAAGGGAAAAEAAPPPPVEAPAAAAEA